MNNKLSCILTGFLILLGGNLLSHEIESDAAQKMLQKAILDDSATGVSHAIKAGAVLNFTEDTKSPLLRAVLLKKKNAVFTLLEAGANPNIIYSGQKLVLYLIKQGDLEIALKFIEKKADFSGVIDNEQDAVTYVATHFNNFKQGQTRQDYFDIIYEMVKNGYDLNANFNNKNLSNNAWYLVLKNGDTQYMGFFIGWGDFPKNPYPMTVKPNANQIFTYPDGSTWTPLLILINYSVEHSKARLIGGTPIQQLLQYGKPNPSQKAKPNNKEQSPISYLLEVYVDSIAQAPSFAIGHTLNYLMEKKANLAEGIELFIKNGGSPDYTITDDNMKRSKIYCTLLGIAIYYNDLNAVKILVERGANINKLTFPYPYFSTAEKKEKKPLEIALEKEDISIAEYLMEHGAQT